MVIELLVLLSLVSSGLFQAEGPAEGPLKITTTTPPPQGMQEFLKRMTTTVKRIYRRTTPPRVSFPENCDYLAFYCLKAFVTGRVCARSAQFTYYTFKNYCMLDYVNCMERYDLWQPVYMGECIEIKPLEEYGHYPYDDDLFLDQYYIIEDI